MTQSDTFEEANAARVVRDQARPNQEVIAKRIPCIKKPSLVIPRLILGIY
jgi:hypothetical protein